MANTYSQIYIHLVFAVSNHKNFIAEEWEEELYKYISGIISNKGHRMLAIGGTHDHLHILVSMSPKESISSLVQMVKSQSTKMIKDKLSKCHNFEWQNGFGCFSYTKSHVPQVVNYILNQKEHHRQKTFLEEYKDMLSKMGIDYDERFIFHKV